ncbi:MAG TPA: UvrD-helicase domain-containing protein, partial [Phycisphaerae bacterium]|nr:UvrD-helicase domain-containing protein [Phycisphaerae bacterium]
MNLTASQRRAVEHRGSNLLVSASAGAGKTEVLAQRCVGLIADPQRPCDIDRLLVVTFTRAAAAELRVRIADMLRRTVAHTSAGPLQRHLRRQQLLVQAAEIGTIDAWCGRLVREHFAQ